MFKNAYREDSGSIAPFYINILIFIIIIAKMTAGSSSQHPQIGITASDQLQCAFIKKRKKKKTIQIFNRYSTQPEWWSPVWLNVQAYRRNTIRHKIIWDQNGLATLLGKDHLFIVTSGLGQNQIRAKKGARLGKKRKNIWLDFESINVENPKNHLFEDHWLCINESINIQSSYMRLYSHWKRSDQ